MKPPGKGLQVSGIRKYTSLGRETPGCLLLTLGEPEADTPLPIRRALCRAVMEGRTHYSPNQGEPALRRAVAACETKRGFAIADSQVLITAGATQGLFTAFLGLLSTGDEVVIPTPAVPLYKTLAELVGAKAVFADVTATDFQLTPELLARVITDRTRMIILNSPSNPTGVVYNTASLAAVKAAVKGKPIFVLCDNVYSLLSPAPCPDLTLDEALREQVLLCQSFSKPYAMTGFRCGYLAGPAPVIAGLLPLQAAQLASVSAFVQDACLTALETDISFLAKDYEKRRAFVSARLQKMGLSHPSPEGAFYVFPQIAHLGLNDEAFCTRLIQKGGVAAVPGSIFDTPGYIRLSCACSDRVLEEAMSRLERFLQAL